LLGNSCTFRAVPSNCQVNLHALVLNGKKMPQHRLRAVPQTQAPPLPLDPIPRLRRGREGARFLVVRTFRGPESRYCLNARPGQ